VLRAAYPGDLKLTLNIPREYYSFKVPVIAPVLMLLNFC
jgi:hypothetical protein